MPGYRIELSISPLCAAETEQALAALRQIWAQPAWIKRQPHGEACILMIQHEAILPTDETPRWFCERLAAGIWQAIGRFARITLAMYAEDGSEIHIRTFEEAEYWRILKSFRLSPALRQ